MNEVWLSTLAKSELNYFKNKHFVIIGRQCRRSETVYSTDRILLTKTTAAFARIVGLTFRIMACRFLLTVVFRT